MRITGPVLDAPNVAELTHFYERLLGWNVEDIAGPWPGHPRETDGHGSSGGQQHEDRDPVRGALCPPRPGLPRPGPKECRSISTFGWKTVRRRRVGDRVRRDRSRAPAGLPADRNRLRVMLDPAGHPFCLWS